MKIKKTNFTLTFLLLVLLTTASAFAQTTSFTYQGRLMDGGTPANGTYEIQFTLWDGIAGGTQQPQPAPVTITRTNVQVSAGSFTVQPLDFGSVAFPGADRYLEISVRRTAIDPFTTLSPRQQITSTPYAIRSLSSATADTATNATQLGGVDAARFVQSDAGGNVNIAGGLTVGGSFSLNTVNAQTQYELGGQRVLAANLTHTSVALGQNSGSTDTGFFNTFLGVSAGQVNSTGASNTFAGNAAGQANTTGSSNSFFGASAGLSNVGTSANAFFGALAGRNNTADANAFFGAFSGQDNTTGSANSFLGFGAGFKNTTGDFNAFFGANTGVNNTIGKENAFFGDGAGAGNVAGSFNTFVGRQAGLNNTASNNSFFGHFAGQANTTGNLNSFFGDGAGSSNTSGFLNSFFGNQSGAFNVAGTRNAFFGASAGRSNNGTANSFFGVAAGLNTTTSGNNSFFGDSAGGIHTTGDFNVFLGAQAGSNNSTGKNNTITGFNSGGGCDVLPCGAVMTGDDNSFYGYRSGLIATSGSSNSFFGGSSGIANTTGNGNAFFGINTGLTNVTGSNNTLLGFQANVGANNLTNANAIGANALASTSNSLVLGSINGVNGASADTRIGIGTTAPVTRLHVVGSSWFQGDNTPLPASAGKGIVMGFSGELGYIASFDYGTFTPKTLLLNNSGGNVGIGTNTPNSSLTVAGLIETTTGGVKFPDGSIQTTAAGGGSGILNQTTLQAGANFNIDGTGTANILNATTQYNLGGSRILVGSEGAGNIFAGFGAGTAGGGVHNSFFGVAAGTSNVFGSGNAFFGFNAGNSNTGGSSNSFFGLGSGIHTTDGSDNSFFGAGAGSTNENGQSNSIFGALAGAQNTNSFNSFFGSRAGAQSTTGTNNSFVGFEAGGDNTAGSDNVYVGVHTGEFNNTGSSNTFLGVEAGRCCTTDKGTYLGYQSRPNQSGLTNTTAIGANAQVGQSNSLVLGSINGQNGATADTRVGIGTTTPKAKLDVTGGNLLIGTPGQGIVLKSPDGVTCKLISIDNAGAMVLNAIPCP